MLLLLLPSQRPSSVPLLLLRLAIAVVALGTVTDLVSASCECGYLDPTTNELWTEASITYFNESGTGDVAFEGTKSIYGQDPPSADGNGGGSGQAWSVVGDFTNKWEMSFGATWRSSVKTNNTFADGDLGLGMRVSTPDLKNRIVDGAQLVTRRRDIAFGSLRTMIIPPNNTAQAGGGAAFKFGTFYNDSETASIGLFYDDMSVSDLQPNITARIDYATRGRDSDPLMLNYTWFDPDITQTYEHRIDWQSDKLLQYRNSGSNSSVNLISYEKGHNATNLPSVASPVSFQFWSNGEPSASQGPPMYADLVTHVVYARLFFNSSLSLRRDEFASQCEMGSTPADSVCSTDDFTLRGSTPYSMASLDRVLPPAYHFSYPLWALILELVSIFMTVSLIAHGLLVQALARRQERRAEEARRVGVYSGSADGAQEKEKEKDFFARPHLRRSGSGTVSEWAPGAPSVLSRSESSSSLAMWVHTVPLDGNNDDTSEEGGMERNPAAASAHLDKAEMTQRQQGQANQQEGALRQLFQGWQDETAVLDQSFDDSAMDQSVFVDNAAGIHQRRGFVGEQDAPELPTHVSAAMVLPQRPAPTFNASDRQQQPGQPLPQATAAPLRPVHRRQGSSFMANPVFSRWKRRRQAEEFQGVALAQPAGVTKDERRNSEMAIKVQPTVVRVFVQRLQEALLINGGKVALTSTGAARIDYLDGMRGYACFFVSFGHFILIYYHGISDFYSPHHYYQFERWYRILLGMPTNNPLLLLGTFFALPARTMCQRYLMRGGLGSMADTTVRRMPRLMLPVGGAALANYFLIDISAFKWVPRLASRTWSTWSYWQDYENVLVFVNAVLTLPWAGPPAEPALVTGYATGVLWTIPVIVQGIWTCMVCALIAHEIKRPWKRFSFYAVCCIASWYANTWDCFFLAGLIVGDLDGNLKYRQWADRGIAILPHWRTIFARDDGKHHPWMRLHGSWLAWIYFGGCVVQQYILQIPFGPGDLMETEELNIHPSWQTSKPYSESGGLPYSYTNPRVSGFALILGLFLIVDLSPTVKTFFRLKIWHFLGSHSMGIYLCHGLVWWTWDAWLLLQLLSHDVPYWAAALVCFFTGYMLLIPLAMCFTLTFETWATSFSKAIWRLASGGAGRKV